MSKKIVKKIAKRSSVLATTQQEFANVLALIDAARTRAVAAVNTELIDLYWSIGEHISRKVGEDGWGKGTVEELAEYIRRRMPNARGFSSSNLWRMLQFYETYRNQPKLAPLVRELSWSHNLAILSRSKRDEEREFYLCMANRERWSYRRKNQEVVEYALSCAMSPAVVADYQDRLPAKKLLQSKLHEFYELATGQAGMEAADDSLPVGTASKKRPARPAK